MSTSHRVSDRALHRLLAAAVLAISATTPAVLAFAPAASAVVVNPADFQQVTLAKGVAEMGEPMTFAVLPDRSVLHTSRNGTLRRTDAAGTTTVVATIPVYSHDEEGLQGVGVDPGFAGNRHVYLYYAPPLSTPAGDAPKDGGAFAAWAGVNRLSRFTLTTAWQLTGEQTILEVPADRGICCHVGGDIDFDAAGNLYLSTGDDTNPFESDGYTPIDERAGRNPAFDAQRSAGNANDLRGKILRIKVSANGSYSIPSGNLFAPGTAGTRPEVYAMGFRNPFRMSVDRATGVVYVGDYGPDAGGASARGPAGQVEFARVTSAGNYGWPYCTGNNTAAETYADYNFATGTVGAKFNCAAPVNNSPRNTGIQSLPGARGAWIRYDDCSVPDFGCGSESPMGGPVYRYDAANPSGVKFPSQYNGVFFGGEFGRRWVKAIDVQSSGAPGAISAFPFTGTQVMDLAFGPDGALYVLDYGSGYFGGDANSALYRIEYIGAGSNRNPIAVAGCTPTSGPAPLTVTCSAAGSSDPDGGALTYSWAFGDGGVATGPTVTHTFSANGTYTVTLTARDPQGATGTASTQVTVGNTAPTVEILTPADGQVFAFGDTVTFSIRVTDPEDGVVDCSRVRMSYILGHDSHGHPITSANGCTGSITVPVDGEHDAAANIFGVWDAEYTDNSGATTHAQHVTQPKLRQAEHFSAQSGVSVFTKTPAHGGRAVGDIHSGDWIAFDRYNAASATGFTARVASAGVGGTLTLRAGSPSGSVLGSVAVPVTGGWETFVSVSGSVTAAPASTTRLYLVFTGGAGALFDVDDFTFVTAPTARRQAEAFTSQSGVQIVADAGSHGGARVGFVDSGDWIAFSSVNVAGAVRLAARVASGGAGGTISVRAGTATGPVLGSVAVPNTGGYSTWVDLSTPLSAGSGQLVLTFSGAAGGGLFDVDDVAVTGAAGAGAGPIVGLASKCLDVSGGGTADGTKIQLWTCNGTAAQQWSRPGDGSVRALGKCLDVAGGATANGTLVQLWTCNGSGAQQWQPDGSSRLMNPQSGRCLDVSGNNSADGTQVHIWDCHTGANQKWSLPA